MSSVERATGAQHVPQPSALLGQNMVRASDGSFAVTVPATSGNVGPGFDTLGLALTLYNTFTFTPAPAVSFEGCEPRFATPNNLVRTSYEAACRELGTAPAAHRIGFACDIPLCGGLGSSSTCIVAGVVAAGVEAGGISQRDVLELATAIEGHPDNVAPAVYGGITCSFMHEREVITVARPVSDVFRFVALCPSYEVRTASARRVLPSEVTREVAVWQMGHATATFAALTTGDAALLREACVDRLHEPYRKALIPDYERAHKVALEAGALAHIISGSGATMLAVCTAEKCDEVATALAAALPHVRLHTLAAADKGAQVVAR